MQIQSNLVIILFLFVGIVILFSTFKSMKIRVMESGFLRVVILAAFVFVVFVSLSYYEKFLGHLEMSKFYDRIFPFPLCVIWIAGYYYYEGMINDRPVIARNMFFLVLFSGAITYLILNLVGFLDSEYADTVGIIISSWFGTIFHVFAIFVTKKILSLFNRRNIKIDFHSLILVCIATFVMGWYYLLGLFPVSLTLINTIGLIGAIFFSVGIGILAMNQYKYGDYIFYTPVPIHAVMLYNGAGILVYSRNVHPDNIRPLFGNKDELISGALTAFQLFFREILGMSTRLNRIEASGYEFFFAPLDHDQGTCVLVASGANYYLHKGLKKFVSNITPEFAERINKDPAISDFQAILDDLLIKSFPFLIIDQQKQKPTDFQ